MSSLFTCRVINQSSYTLELTGLHLNWEWGGERPGQTTFKPGETMVCGAGGVLSADGGGAFTATLAGQDPVFLVFSFAGNTMTSSPRAHAEMKASKDEIFNIYNGTGDSQVDITLRDWPM